MTICDTNIPSLIPKIGHIVVTKSEHKFTFSIRLAILLIADDLKVITYGDEII